MTEMADLPSEFRGHVDVPAPLEEVYALLADIPDSTSHFPDLEKVARHEDGYLWTVKKSGVGRLSAQMIYACRYLSDEAAHTVRWEPIPGTGNTTLQGSWRLEQVGGGTRLHLHNQLTMHLDIPRLMVRAARPVVNQISARLMGQYLENLKRTFSGGDGRVSARAVQRD
jgi:carbon monoxide dehydrogenase subunit G